MENRTRITGKSELSLRPMSPPRQTIPLSKRPNWSTLWGFLLAILCELIPHTALAEVPLVNPSFETPVLTEGQFLTPIPSSAGWQTRGAVTLINGGFAVAASPYRVEPPMGRQWVNLRPGTSISQTLTLSPGTYFVSLQAMQEPYYLGAPLLSIRVKLGSTTVATLSPSIDLAKLSFAPITIASAGVYQLTIDVPEPSPPSAYTGVYLDDVVLNQLGVNSKPSVAVTYPQPGQTFSNTYTIDLQATALDHDGSLTKVEFYDGATLLGTSYAAPWKYALLTGTVGSRAITAKAYDNTGATNTSDVTNFSHHAGGASPYIANGTFENPTFPALGGGDAYNVSGWNTTNGWVGTYGFVGAGYSMPPPLQGRQALYFTMQYEGGSASQNVNLPAGNYGLSLRTRVNFFQQLRIYVPGGLATIAHGDNFTGGITGKFYVPFTHTGGYAGIVLQALKPYYNSSYAPITVDDIVIGPAGTATVSMMMPASGDTYTTPAAIPLQAKVATYDRDVAKVEYFDGEVLIGTVTTAPYLFDWLNVRAGMHSITAKVTDSQGKTATSAAVSVVVNAGTPNPAFFNAGFERGMSTGGYLGSTGWGWYSPTYSWAYAAGNGWNWIIGAPLAPEGVGMALLTGYAAMMQEVEFPVGTYKISFKAAQQSASGTVAMRVKVNGADVGSFTPTAAFGTYSTNAFAISAAGLKTVRFEGMSPGNAAFILLDDLSIASSTPGGGDVVVPNDPPATVSASAGLTYGAQAFGTLSASQNITITNTGSVVATVVPPVVATNDFIPVSTCPGQLGAGQSCVVTMTFVPNASGIRTDSVVIGGSNGTTLTTVVVSGTGDLGIVFGGNGTTATGGTNVEDKNVGGYIPSTTLSVLDLGSAFDPEKWPPVPPTTATRLPTITWWEYMDLLWALDKIPVMPGPPDISKPTCDDTEGGGTVEPGSAEFADPTSYIGANLPPTDATHTADPIHAGLGSKSHPQIDYAAKGGFPLAFIRTYQAQATNAAGLARQKLGPGWYGNWDKTVNISAGGSPARVTRGDGSSIVFNKQTNGTWTPITSDIVATLTTVLNGMVENGWTLKDGNKTENYNATGRLTSVTLSTGENYLVEYDTSARLKTVKDPSNRMLTFNYDAKGRLANIVDPSMLVTSYTYDDGLSNIMDRLGRVTSVTFPDNRARRYKYEDSVRKFALTSIATFENNVETLYATFSYDQSNGRAMGNSFGTSANEAQRSGRAAVYYETGTNSVSYDPSRVVRDAQGNFNLITAGQYPSYATVKRQFTTILGSVLPTWIQYTHICAGCPDITESFSYDANARLVSQTDRRGIITAYTYTPDGRGLVATTTQAAGTQIARTVTTTWHPTFRVPTQVVEPTRTTNYTYDTGGRMLTKTVVAAGQPNRIATNTYNAQGKLQSSIDPLNNTTTYTYFDIMHMCVPCRGLVNTVSNPKGQMTTYNSYDANGNPLSIAKANGTTTTFTYDARGRVITQTDAGLTTSYTYTTNGQINTIIDPYGAVTSHLYDDALRLYGKDQSNGEKIRYTLDNAGRTTQTQTFDVDNTLSTTSSTVYDGLNRVLQTINASGKITNYTYDANGNVTAVVDPNNLTTSTQYDALNRPILVTDPNLKTVATSYTPDDKVAAVIDPNNNTTSYTYNGFGEQLTIQSPDTGGTTMTYNAGGLLTSKTDARNKTTSYTYDVLGRVTSVVYTDGSITQTYDVATNGVGRLASVTDLSGSTTYTYDSAGRVATKTSFITGVPSNRVITYGRDTLGRVTSITYPGGNVVGMTYTQGRVTNMTLNGAPLISAIDYFPLGGPESWLLGPNLGTSAVYMRYIDLNSRIEKYNTPSGYRKLTFDNASRITGMGDYLGTSTTANATQTFGYDNVGRLTSFTGFTSNGNAQANITQTQGFSYDSNGNRLTSVLNGVTSTYGYQTGNNRLATVSGGFSKSNTYDLSGNLTNDGSAVMTYDARGRMITANASGLSTSYLINYQNLRVKKSNSSETRYFVYDDAGHMMGEYDAAGAVVAEYVWLGDTMVAVKGTMPCLSGGTCIETGTAYVWADHLNTPRELTRVNASNQQVSIWKWDSLPFGETTANANPSSLGVMTFNHRFPGQYRDSETGLHQNWYREFDPRLGRYVTSDPLGLSEGTNTYIYVHGRPISLIDRMGLGDEIEPVFPELFIIPLARVLAILRGCFFGNNSASIGKNDSQYSHALRHTRDAGLKDADVLAAIAKDANGRSFESIPTGQVANYSTTVNGTPITYTVYNGGTNGFNIGRITIPKSPGGG